MKLKAKHSQRGIALLVSLFALILVTAIGLALMFSTNGETAINSGFRQSNLAYFAARSGVEEARDRMRYKFASNANGLADYLPDVPVGSVNAGPPVKPGVLYITNPLGSETVAPWDYTNVYFDDELCHEINLPGTIHNSPGTTDVPCPHTAQSIPSSACPGASCWYQSKSAETLPGTPAITLAYKWTRINLKLNESTSPWCVLYGTSSGCNHLTGNPASDQVCYNGKNEFVLADVNTPIDVPGQFEGTSLPSQLAMALTMFGGGSNGNGNSSGGSATAGFSSSSTSTTGTSTTGNGTNANSGHGTSSSSSSSTTGTTTTGSSTTGSSTTGSSTTGTTTTGTSTTGTTTGSLTTGSLTTGSLTTGSLTTGSLTTGSLTTGSLTTGSLTTGSSSTSSSSTGSSTTGTSTTGTSTTGSSSSSSSSTGGSGQCGTSAPPLPGNPIGIGGGPITANACIDVDSQPVYMLTTLAMAPTQSSANKARRIIQYEVAKLAVPPVPAALTLVGPTPTASMPSSNPFNVLGSDGGTDTNGGTCNGGGGSSKPAIVTVTDKGNSTETATQLATDARNTLINAIPSNRLGNYTGVDGCTPDVQNGQNVTNSLFSTPLGLQGIVQNVQNAATQTAQNNPTYSPTGCTVSNCISSLGTDASPKVTVVDGDLSLSGATTGAGILLVTGTLTYSGNFSFDGIVMAIGAGKIVANGGGNGQFNGAVVIANIGDNSGCATNSSPCYKTNPVQANLNLDPTTHQPVLGSPTLDWSGGGGNGIQYDTCALQLANSAPTYTVIARREITY